MNRYRLIKITRTEISEFKYSIKAEKNRSILSGSVSILKANLKQVNIKLKIVYTINDLRYEYDLESFFEFYKVIDA